MASLSQNMRSAQDSPALALPIFYAAFMPSPAIARRAFTGIGSMPPASTGRADMALVYLVVGAAVFALFGLYAAGLRRL